MKRTLITLGAVALTIACATPSRGQNYDPNRYNARPNMRSEDMDRYGNRMVDFDNRIQQGEDSGELTRHEAWILRHEEARLERMRDRADRNGWSDDDRARVRRAEAQLNRDIWQLKHNDERVSPY